MQLLRLARDGCIIEVSNEIPCMKCASELISIISSLNKLEISRKHVEIDFTQIYRMIIIAM
jgi:hypothetical protein